MMLEITQNSLVWVILCLVFLGLVLVAICTPYDHFGEDNKRKLIAFMRSYFNLYIIAGLILVMAAKQWRIISQDLFVALFVGGLSAIGFNLSKGVKKIEDS